MRWTFEERARNVHKFTITLENVDDEQFFLLQSDVHWDNPHCQRELLHKHWQQAKERNAPILDNGDFFCAMQGKWDKRANKDDLREEHRCGDYLDALVRTAADDLAPYKDLVTVRGVGNHEDGIRERHETNLTERLVERLRALGSPAVLGGYSGYVVFEVTYRQTRHASFKLHYHHGAGGGGPVTRGVIQSNRQAVYLPDADLVLNGHTHDQWVLPIARVRLNHDCTKVVHGRQLHVRIPGYKEEYQDGYGGFHVRKWGPPKPIGAAWLRLYMADYETPDFEIRECR